MNLKHTISLFFVVLFLVACNGPPPPTRIVTPPSATDTPSPTNNIVPDKGLHFLIASEGSEAVQIKRLQRDWLAFQPATFGTIVSRGDLIQPPPDGNATILCADLTLQILEQEEGVHCQVEEPKLIYDDVRIINPMALGQSIPTIFHPRNTNILDGRPWLRWQDTGGASYTVSLIAQGESIWQQTGITNNKLRYPDNAPPLQPGIRYSLEVIDEDTEMSSGQDPMPGLGFQLLTPEEVAQINQTAAEISTLPLDAAGQNFALAIYYAGQGVYGEALTLLDEVIAVQPTPLVHLWRGQMFLAIRLNNPHPQAQEAYTEAVSLAETMGDLEAQAQAQAGLWWVVQDETYFDAAVVLYQQLGDEQAITELQEDAP